MITIVSSAIAIMFPCFYKQVFGFSCPLCGCQRAIVLLCHGKWEESILMFPPLFSLVFTLFLVIIRLFIPFISKKVVRRALVVDAAFLLLNLVYQNVVN